MSQFLQNLQNYMFYIFQFGDGSDWQNWFWALGVLTNMEFLLEIVFIFVLFLLGRYIYDFVTPFSLAEVLTSKDNKALAFSFACYLSGLGIVLIGVYNSPSTGVAPEALEEKLSYLQYILYALSDLLFWGAIGICLLLIAQVLNNLWILSRFDNYTEIVGRQNLAVGIVEGASYIASAILIYAVMQGQEDNESFLLDALLTLFYFTIGQLILILYSRIFIVIRSKLWNFHREIGKNNIAAAVSFSFSFVSFAVLLASYIANFYSFYGLLFVAVFNTVFIFLLHIAVDKLFFPKVSLAQEIASDQNWGAAFIEGVLILFLCLIYVATLLTYLANI